MNIIQEQRIKLKMTMKELSELVGVSEATISRWESGNIANMRRDKISALSKALKLSPIEIMNNNYDNFKNKSSSVRIPVLGYVRAGLPMEAVENIIDYEEIPAEMLKSGEYFGLKIQGDSMLPRFTEGDVVIVKKQSTAENGDIVVVLVDGCDATIKKLYRLDNGIQLLPTNSVYEPLFYSAEEINSLPVSIVGKVVELRAKF